MEANWRAAGRLHHTVIWSTLTVDLSVFAYAQEEAEAQQELATVLQEVTMAWGMFTRPNIQAAPSACDVFADALKWTMRIISFNAHSDLNWFPSSASHCV